MLGDRDSEIALVIEDSQKLATQMNGEPCIPSSTSLAHSISTWHANLPSNCEDICSENTWESLGKTKVVHWSVLLCSVDIIDPIISSFYRDVWLATAEKNSKMYAELFHDLPSDHINSFYSLVERIKVYQK